MSELYDGYELNEYLEGSWFNRENALFKAIIDKLPASEEVLVTDEHVHCKLVSSDEDVDPALQIDPDGYCIIGTGVVDADALLHIHAATAGVVDAVAGTLAAIENSGNAFLSFLTPNTATVGVYFGDPEDNDHAGLTYNHATNLMQFKVDGNATLKLAAAYMQVPYGHPIKGTAGGAGLQLQNGSGAGCAVNDTGDLKMDTDKYFQWGVPMIGSAGAAYNSYFLMPVKDDSGTVWYLLARSTTTP